MDPLEQCRLVTYCTYRTLRSTDVFMRCVKTHTATSTQLAQAVLSADAKRVCRTLLLCVSRRTNSPESATSIVRFVLPYLSFEGPSGVVLSSRKRHRDEGVSARHFSLVPPTATGDNTSPCLFVRMLSTHQLHDDELNRFFGRYGQTGSSFLASRTRSPEFTDYRITVDSVSNAQAAVVEAVHPMIMFVAFSADEQTNEFSMSDLDSVGAHWEPAEVDPLTTFHHEPTAAAEGPIDTFVPDIVVDGLPVWATEDQVVQAFSSFGSVVSVRLAVNDRTGASCGCAAVRMSSVAETVRAMAFHGRELLGVKVACGVVDNCTLVSLRDADRIRLEEEGDTDEDGILGGPHIDDRTQLRAWL